MWPRGGETESEIRKTEKRRLRMKNAYTNTLTHTLQWMHFGWWMENGTRESVRNYNLRCCDLWICFSHSQLSTTCVCAMRLCDSYSILFILLPLSSSLVSFDFHSWFEIRNIIRLWTKNEWMMLNHFSYFFSSFRLLAQLLCEYDMTQNVENGNKMVKLMSSVFGWLCGKQVAYPYVSWFVNIVSIHSVSSG